MKLVIQWLFRNFRRTAPKANKAMRKKKTFTAEKKKVSLACHLEVTFCSVRLIEILNRASDMRIQQPRYVYDKQLED